VPRDISGEHLAKLLAKYGYRVTCQTGGHLRLTTTIRGEGHVTIPLHNPLKVGTLSSILTDVASHVKISKDALIRDLFL
jgi:predicted RNA binding protein YcfA (HicA-like mRNA interferase family)